MTGPLRVCIVENHADTRQLLATLLAYRGHAVETAERCASAIALFERQRFDVLLSDIGLPDGDGWQLLGQLQPLNGPLYAIAMSGYGATTDRDKSKAAGFRHHLVKPVDFQTLRRLMDEATQELARP